MLVVETAYHGYWFVTFDRPCKVIIFVIYSHIRVIYSYNKRTLKQTSRCSFHYPNRIVIEFYQITKVRVIRYPLHFKTKSYDLFLNTFKLQYTSSFVFSYFSKVLQVFSQTHIYYNQLAFCAKLNCLNTKRYNKTIIWCTVKLPKLFVIRLCKSLPLKNFLFMHNCRQLL